MINFVIVEDNPLHLKKTESYIVKYMMQNTLEFEVIKFDKLSEKLFKYVSNTENNNIYILDYELGNGIALDVARKIRKYEWRSPIIIFTVNGGGMALSSFKQRLQILDFINKRTEPEKNLFELFDICLQQLNVSKNFKCSIAANTFTIDYNSILYVYKDTVDRKTVVVTDNDEFVLNITLGKAKSLLSKDFVATHKSYIVNLKRVAKLDWKNCTVTFDNGKVEPLLSRTHKKELSGK